MDQQEKKEVTAQHFDVEQMLRDTIPGGYSCDPQQVADDIRGWVAKHQEPCVPKFGHILNGGKCERGTEGCIVAHDPELSTTPIADAFLHRYQDGQGLSDEQTVLAQAANVLDWAASRFRGMDNCPMQAAEAAEFAGKLRALSASGAKPAIQGEPVVTMHMMSGHAAYQRHRDLPEGSHALYASPQASPDGGAALRAIMRMADAAKEPCGMDPESPAAIRNGKFAGIAQVAAQGLGLVRGPDLADGGAEAQQAAPQAVATDIAAIRHTLMTGLAHNAAIAELDRIATPAQAEAKPAGQGEAVSNLMRAIDAYAFDYKGEGKLAPSRRVVERDLAAALATPLPAQVQPAQLNADDYECCGNPVVGAEYMGAREMVCCGNPEPKGVQPAEQVGEPKCPSCGAASEVAGFVCVDCYYSEQRTGELSTDYVKGFADGQAALASTAPQQAEQGRGGK